MQPNYGTEGHVCGKQLCNKWALKTRLMILRKEKEVIVTRTPQRARHPNRSLTTGGRGGACVRRTSRSTRLLKHHLRLNSAKTVPKIGTRILRLNCSARLAYSHCGAEATELSTNKQPALTVNMSPKEVSRMGGRAKTEYRCKMHTDPVRSQ